MLAIEESGGIVGIPKTTFPKTHWLSLFKDSDGNIHGFW
jgi:predicted enzyme related to lactoylglutathione lyase